MLRFLKMIGMTALMLSAGAVQVASAAEFHSEGTSTTLAGSQIGTGVLTTNGGTVECEEATYSGSQFASTVSVLSLTPQYGNCSALSGFASAEIHLNGCYFTWGIGSGSGNTWNGSLTIDCPAGKEITMTAHLFGTTKCILHIPPQGPVGPGVIHHNEGVGTTRDIRITANIVEDIHYTETEGTGFGACEDFTGFDASLSEEVTVTGRHGSPGTHTGIWIA